MASTTTNGTINPTTMLNPAALSHLLTNGSAQLLQTLPQMMNNPTANAPPPLINPLTQQSLLSTAPTLLSTATSQSTTSASSLRSNSSHYNESKLHPQALARNQSPPNNGGTSNRTITNGEITVTTSHGPNSSQSMKRSPSSLSPNCNDNSTADLLIDSPSK